MKEKDGPVTLNDELSECCKLIIHQRNQLIDLAYAFKRTGNLGAGKELLEVAESLYATQSKLRDAWNTYLNNEVRKADQALVSTLKAVLK